MIRADNSLPAGRRRRAAEHHHRRQGSARAARPRAAPVPAVRGKWQRLPRRGRRLRAARRPRSRRCQAHRRLRGFHPRLGRMGNGSATTPRHSPAHDAPKRQLAATVLVNLATGQVGKEQDREAAKKAVEQGFDEARERRGAAHRHRPHRREAARRPGEGEPQRSEQRRRREPRSSPTRSSASATRRRRRKRSAR